MSVPQRAPESEAQTVVSEGPVHVRRWTSRPRVVERAIRAWRPSSRLIRRAVARIGGWLKAAWALTTGRVESLLLRAEARLLARRRPILLRELGQAYYVGDRARCRKLKQQLEGLDAELGRKRAAAEAARAEASRRARRALASARPTEVREPDSGETG